MRLPEGRRADLPWILALAFLALVAVVGRPGDEPGMMSRDPSPSGQFAFYRLLESLLPEVGRSTESSLRPDADTMCILGPRRYPTPGEWRRLRDWTAEGHTLVFAARHEDPIVDLDPFPVRIVPIATGPYSMVDGAPRILAESWEGDSIPPPSWISEGELDLDGGDALVRVGETVQAARLEVESGILIVIATDHPFRNESLQKAGSAVLAARLVESGYVMGRTVFDESLNLDPAAELLGVLFTPVLRSATFQVLAALLLLGWGVSRRFGPVREPDETPRRATLQHAIALGRAHRRRRNVEHAASIWREYVQLRRAFRPAGVPDAPGTSAAPAGQESRPQRLVDIIQSLPPAPVGPASGRKPPWTSKPSRGSTPN